MALELFPYQAEGARFLHERARAGLFDKPRVGKTAQVVRALDLGGLSRGIVVVPAVAREQWRSEFRRFGLQNRRVAKGNSIHDFVAWANGRFDTLVTSYEMAVSWTKYLHERCEPLQFMVFDEAHYLKNLDAKRTNVLLGEHADGPGGALQWAINAWWLTGTPVPNDPMDILTFLRFQRIMPLAREAFRKRYFSSRPKTFGTAQTARAEMLPELRQLIANNSLCRSLSDIGLECPPLMVSPYLIDGDTQSVRDMLLQHPGLDQIIRTTLENDLPLSRLDAPHIATLRRIIGQAKAIPYAATILGELESGLDKIVIFGQHREVLETIRGHLWKHGVQGGLIYGGMPEKEREAVKLAFDSDSAFRFVACNLRAAGVALTLAASAALDMVESDWAPMTNYQAVMRVYGPSHVQRRAVRVRFITLANSFDETINEIISAKTEAIAVMDKHEADLRRMLG